MRYLVLILIFFLAVIIQTSLLPFINIYGVKPNLVLILLLIWAIAKEFKNIWGLIILAGLFLDLFSGLFFGVSMLSLLVTFFLLIWLVKNLFGQINFGILTALIVIATLVYNLLLLALTKLFQPDFIISWLSYLVYSIPIEIIDNLLVGYLLVFCLKRVYPLTHFPRSII